MGNVGTAAPAISRVRATDGVELYTELRAPASTPKLTVVLLHGWTGDNRLWRRQVADLPAATAAGTAILTVDLRGHGRSGSGPVDSTTLEQLADDLSSVLRERVPRGPVVLVGHSLGGMTVLEYAHRHADDFAARVVGVVLVSTSAEGSSRTSYGVSPRLARLVRPVERGFAGVLARFGGVRPHRHVMPLFAPGIRWLVFGSHAEADVLRLALSMVGSTALRAIGGFRPSVHLHRRVESLAAMRRLPVAVLVGGGDRLTPKQCADTIAEALPEATLVFCPDAGHMLPLECPEQVTDAVAAICAQAARHHRPPAPRRAADNRLPGDPLPGGRRSGDRPAGARVTPAG